MTIKNNHLRKGNDNAPLKLEVFANVSCPGSVSLQCGKRRISRIYRQWSASTSH